VNRSSFYAHFTTTEDVALFVLGDRLQLLAERDIYRRLDGMPGREASRQVLSELIAALLDAKDELSTVFNTARAAARMRFAELLTAGTMSFFDRLDIDAGDELKSAAALFVGNGAAAVLIDWLLDTAPCPQDEIIGVLVDLNPAWVINSQKRSVIPPTDIHKEGKK
jgi:AcrR family transcriptional regulator